MNAKIKTNDSDPKIYKDLTKCEILTGYMGNKFLYLSDEKGVVDMYPLAEVEAIEVITE